MKISDFKSLISNLPEQQQSFPIKRSNWERSFNSSNILEECFNNKEEIEISREDIFAVPECNLEELFIKTILWGYPIGMRGTNFSKLLQNKNTILDLLTEAKSGISNWRTHSRIAAQIPGLGLSTYSKFLFFIHSKVENFPAVILDLRIINTIQKQAFDELNSLPKITYENGWRRYVDYLTFVDWMAKELNTDPGKVEMFLFEYGLNVKELRTS